MRYDQSVSVTKTMMHRARDENSLLNIVMPIINILITLKTSLPEGDVKQINVFLVQCLNAFEQNASRLGFPVREILATKYCLCTALDEAIMCTAWGRESAWNEWSLLNEFYKETFGGERFYIILETMLEDPASNAPLLEILYILLALGFKGKNYNKDPLILKAIQIDVYYKIELYLSYNQDYLISPHQTQSSSHPQLIIRSFWVMSACVLIFLFGINIISALYIDKITAPLFKTLNNVNIAFEISNRNTHE